MTTPTDKSEVASRATVTITLREYADMEDEIDVLKSHVDTYKSALYVANETSAKLQSQLTNLRAQVESAENSVDEQWLKAIAKHWVTLTGKPWETLDGETPEEGRHANVTAIFQHIEDLKSQVERLHADGAVCQVALEMCRDYVNGSSKWIALEPITKALSTDVGADLLDRYREAVELVKTAEISLSFGVGSHDLYDEDRQAAKKWFGRRDTLLATVKGGVDS